MWKVDFFNWLTEQGCEIIPKEGINNSAPPIEVVNKKTGRYRYITLLPREEIVPKWVVEKCIKDLGLEPPYNY